MKEQEIREYIAVRFPEENESCEWKEYKNLQNSLCGHEADAQAKYLRKSHFIEGRKPKYYLSYEVVAASKNPELKRQYVKNKSFDDDYFRKLILYYLEKFGTASRKDIDSLIKDKLSAVLSDEQKTTKVYNLMRQLRASGKIVWGKNKLWKLA